MQEFNHIIKNDWGKIVALLANYLKDIDLAEDAMQDALESALIHWQKNGIPNNPQGWLFNTAKHKALDKIRRAKNFIKKQQQYRQLLELNFETETLENDYTIPDERLRLIFTCCHPALDSSVAVALTLRMLGGLTTQEIAKAFLVTKQTMAQRLVRGKKKIKKAGVPFVAPEKKEFNQRLKTVLTVLYLIFNEGYYTSCGDVIIRETLCKEAIRLTTVLLKLCPQHAEIKGLLSLMLLHDSRRKTRYNQKGEFVALESQDRSLWNTQKIEHGLQLIQSALKQKQIGSFQLQAAISAIHAESQDYESTNWLEIVLVYDELLKIDPSDIIRLNRLAALANIRPASEILIELNKLKFFLDNYQPFYTVKADLLVKSGKLKEAKEYYAKAIEMSDNNQIKNFLLRKKNHSLKL
ncbi:MAG: RNA polymerase sigma factor [Proteobacteria bacterium]|nr:RNA polymerase sigma factor [Pseudomonadota bacterium]